ncbi:hypothetical protein BFJ63_vAg5637 [Fusarium oxysporum f. sp. narcissi]|uniref:Uncharacterized protein n=1 Tax=Fusarium oxysporum f. sp. narcissi TaxID=451672 RepID=A0A4Q2VXA5_FUSOX|nr:hypothetical protein BFJ63_vAg5637 [Fusarium oxysporum f. sp. narcissi]
MTRHPEVPIRDTVICLFECFVDAGHSLSKPLGVFVILLLRYGIKGCFKGARSGFERR